MSEIDWQEGATADLPDEDEGEELEVGEAECSWGSWRAPRRLYRLSSVCDMWR